MVQVDIFWSYGIGAGLALAAYKQLSKDSEQEGFSIWKSIESPFFTKTLLFLALVFVPSGFWLLWEFPSWETMHVGDRNLPVWLVGLFSVTNISQGVLAFILCHWAISKGKEYLAYLQFFFGYFGMFFILVHGWDGIGYKRFLSETPEQLVGWTWETGIAWLSSDVAYTLVGMGTILIPVLTGMVYRWNGMEQKSIVPAQGFMASIFIGALGSAIICSLLLNTLGTGLGTVAAILFMFVLLHPAAPLMHRIFLLMVPTAKERAVQLKQATA